MTDSRDGGCACGAARYQMAGPPMIVHACHCLDCQRLSGGAFAINALIEADRVTLLQGEVESTQVPTPSGRGQTITRCARCKVALWSIYGSGKMEAIRFLRVGTLDEPHAFEPDIHIYTRSKVPWLELPPEVRAFPDFYNAKEVWPADSLARFGAALG